MYMFFGLMASTSRNVSFEACIFRFFTVFAEFEFFTVIPIILIHTVYTVHVHVHGHFCIINFEYAWL